MHLSKLIFQIQRHKDPKGFTVIELLTIMLVVGILAAIVGPSINFGTDPLKDTTNRVAGDFKLIRARAMSQTSGYRLRPASATQLIVERAPSCDPAATWEPDPSFTAQDLLLNDQYLDVGRGIEISAAEIPAGTAVNPATNWNLCFNSRGLADKNLEITLRDTETSKQRRIEVFIGGTVQIYEN